MKTISMDYQEYKQDLLRSQITGQNHSLENILKALELKSDKEKIDMLFELLEDSSQLLDRYLKALGLYEQAQKQFQEVMS